MAKFYVDFDIDDIMQSIEEELGEAIQEDVESETEDMFKRLPSNSKKLLDEILASDNPAQMLSARFEKCSDREDDELRGMLRELKEKGYVVIQWGDNVPYRVIINNSARTYDEQLAEYERRHQSARTINNYNFNNSGGIMILGDVSDSTILFDALREKVAQIQDGEEISARISDMENSVGTKTFAEKYNAFIQAAANHMTLFAPLIPALTQLLSQVR